MRSLRGHAGVITDLTVSCDNTLLATASEDRFIRIWNAGDGTPLAILHGHTNTINYVHFHPFLNIVVSGSDDGSVRLWDLSAIKPACGEGVQENGVLAALPPAAHPLPTVFEHWTTDGPTQHKARVKAISICPFGSYLATGSDDSIARVWSLVEVEKKATPTVLPSSDALNAPHMGVGTRRRTEPGVDQLGGSGGSTASAPAAHGRPGASSVPHLVCRLAGHKKHVSDISYSHTGDRLFTGSMSEGVVLVWSWVGTYNNLSHLVLNMTTTLEGEEGDDGAAQAGGKAKPGCDNALWTCDDRMIVTTQSTRPHNDVETGNWMHCLKVRWLK